MAARKGPVIDTTTPEGKRIQRRLEKELVIWLGTVGADGRPHAVLVWFLWEGDSFLIYSLPGQKVNDIAGNAAVTMHLNSTVDGSDVVRIDGEAKRVRRHPPAHEVPKYIRKYAALIKSYGWKPDGFSRDYNVVLSVRPTRLRTT